MRFMMLVIQKDPGSYGPDAMPDPESVAAMAVYNEDLMKAGVLLSMEGLHPQATATRITWNAGQPTAVDGPFAEAKEAVGGYWIIDVRSPEEARQWALRAPMGDGYGIEVRRVFEFNEFPEEVQAAAAGEPEMRAELQARASAGA